MTRPEKKRPSTQRPWHLLLLALWVSCSRVGALRDLESLSAVSLAISSEIVTYLFIVVVLKVVLVVKVLHVLALESVLVPQCSAREVVDSARDDLLLELLSDLVVGLEALVELLKLLLLEVVSLERLGAWWLRRLEEGEEGWGVDDFSDDSGSAGSWGKCLSSDTTLPAYSHLFLCFLISTFLVRSLSSFHLMS